MDLRRTGSFSVLIVLTMILFLCTLASAETPLGAAVEVPEPVVCNDAPGNAVVGPDKAWHTDLTFYLWFPGVHGTMGRAGREVDFRASAGDLLSHFRFGVMGAVQAQRGRFVLIGDLMWVRLGADRQRALPFPGLPELSAQVKASQFILTPEVGYRFVDGENLRIDALMGFRYWRLGSSLQFTPSRFGLNFSGSNNWIDPLMGARIQIPFPPKFLITVLGDWGGWGAGSQLDYQILGALGFKITPRVTLGIGYRYLFVNYRRGDFRYETAMSGVMLGLTGSFK